MAKKKVFSIGTALSQGLEETIESAQNYSGELRVDVIPLKKIELDSGNPRELALNIVDIQEGIKTNDPQKERKLNERESLQSIANSIKAHGVINPIIVYKTPAGYRLITGERRTLASFIAGKQDIQARILDEKPDSLKISLLQWIENIERSDLSLCERLNNLKKIVNAYARSKYIEPNELTVTDLGHLIGCVKSQALKYKSLLDADASLNKLINENKITSLNKAAFIASIHETHIRQQVINACLMGATLSQLMSLAKQNSIKAKPLQPKKSGRHTTMIKLGATKNSAVVKMIMETLLKNHSLMQLAEQFKGIDWQDYRVVSEAFNRLLRTLEKIHA